MSGEESSGNGIGGITAGGVALMVVSLFISSMGIAVSAHAGLGTTPQATLPYVLSLGLPMTLGFWTLVVNTVFVFVQWLLLGRRFGTMLALQVPVMLLFSLFNDVSMLLFGWLEPINYLESWALVLLSVVLISLGTALAVKADVSYGPADGMVRVIARLRRTEFGSVKLWFDILMVSLAVASSLMLLGGLDGVREGTVAAMLLIGPVVRAMTRALDAERDIVDEKRRHGARGPWR